jgi:hypothetical protein
MVNGKLEMGNFSSPARGEGMLTLITKGFEPFIWTRPDFNTLAPSIKLIIL